ncbi:leader peptidase (prepilin peptidase) / N-methyltransferase [Saccharopolyspora flava]|uniref:Leader peptidase (Prepilin peptidase) / N-methyltransferase n=1 Tax=Saccharopolyspora flava TaxID=95161 RepID=A0A1I6UYD5_9PSEU|nr:leader peptidase (prepilin peptidase) / N-methyltransferase [Saccharopolyspora flava]
MLVRAGWCEAAVACAWAVTALREPPWWWMPLSLLVGWGAVLLGACDLRVRRLPDVLTLPAYPAVAVLVGLAAAHRPGVVLGSVAGLALFGGTYLLVRLVVPAAMGGGDVKLAGALGMAVGAVSVQSAVAVMVAAAVLTLVAALARRTRAVPHGPAMLLPSWLVTLSGP